MHTIQEIIESPYTALSVAIVLGALALSGKFNVTATQTLLVAAWAVIVIGLRSQPLPVMIGGALAAAGLLIILAYWFRPDAVPSYSGKLEAETIFSPKNHVAKRAMEIGDSNTILHYIGPEGTPFIVFEKSNLTIEIIDKKLAVSTQIHDRKGNLVAEIQRNEWKVAQPPRSWDRNYNANALEVKDDTGRIVLQIRLLPDRVQIQGEWWTDEINGTALISPTPGAGGHLVIFGTKFRREDAPAIRPIFEYPSELHFGELKKSQ